MSRGRERMGFLSTYLVVLLLAMPLVAGVAHASVSSSVDDTNSCGSPNGSLFERHGPANLWHTTTYAPAYHGCYSWLNMHSGSYDNAEARWFKDPEVPGSQGYYHVQVFIPCTGDANGYATYHRYAKGTGYGITQNYGVHQELGCNQFMDVFTRQYLYENPDAPYAGYVSMGDGQYGAPSLQRIAADLMYYIATS